MNNDIPDGAQFLIIKDTLTYKVTAFPDFPIEIAGLAAVNASVEDFLEAKRVGFILSNVDEKSATIKFLNSTNDDLSIPFGERKEFSVDGNAYMIELWAVRYNAPVWDQWKISF